MGELVDLIDRDDRTVGTARLDACLSEGLLHRAVAVMVFRTDGNLLLQRRSTRDIWHPGRWTVSCTGHVKAGESYAAAARRELAEELGMRARLVRIAKLNLPRVRSRGLTERETVCVFACTTDAAARPDPRELEGVEAAPPRVVRRMMKGRMLTPDAKIVLGRCFSLGLSSSLSRRPTRSSPYRARR